MRESKRDKCEKKKNDHFCGMYLNDMCGTGGVKLYRIHEENRQGILLAFDDYAANSWEAHFDLFDEYDVKATFFVNAAAPTDFCYRAQKRGHEIAYHTMGHMNLREASEEEIYEQAIAPIEVFKEKGINLTTFAYPYGAYNEKLNEMLQPHYKILRGAYFGQVYCKDDMRKGFVESMSLDNINYESREDYEMRITELLEAVKTHEGQVVSVYSHAISPGGAWCVSEEKLTFLFRKAKEMKLKFYTYKELQKPSLTGQLKAWLGIDSGQ